MSEIVFQGDGDTPVRTMYLPCRLSDTELLAKGKELSERLHRVHALESEKKSHNDAIRRQVDQLESESRLLAAQIRTKQEERDVEVEEQRDDVACDIHVVRLDLHEIVSSRPMTPVEKQLPLMPPEARESNGRRRKSSNVASAS